MSEGPDKDPNPKVPLVAEAALRLMQSGKDAAQMLMELSQSYSTATIKAAGNYLQSVADRLK